VILNLELGTAMRGLNARFSLIKSIKFKDYFLYVYFILKIFVYLIIELIIIWINETGKTYTSF